MLKLAELIIVKYATSEYQHNHGLNDKTLFRGI